jgi:hypothetical protein
MSNPIRLLSRALLIALLGASSAEAREVAQFPFQLLDNRVFVPATLNGHGPYSFILDNGASSWDVLQTIAQQLNLKSGKSVNLSGAGEGQLSADLVQVKEAGLGAAIFRNETVAAHGFSALNNVIGFTQLDGVAGVDVFNTYVVDIDFDARLIRLLAPQDYTPPVNAIVVPFEIYSDYLPLVQGRIGGVEGRFIVDLGDRSSLTLFGPFWRAHGMDKTLGPTLDALTGYGIGGPVRGLVVRAGHFEFGPAKVDGVVARLSLQRAGAFADPHIAGSIGTGVLKHFRVAFDFAHKRMVLVPGKSYATADALDRSGLWLGRGDNGFQVYDVIAGSPGAQAGLRVGDIVTAVDGKPAAQVDLFALRARLSDPNGGDRIRLAYRRAQTQNIAELTLRDLLPRNG